MIVSLAVFAKMGAPGNNKKQNKKERLAKQSRVGLLVMFRTPDENNQKMNVGGLV